MLEQLLKDQFVDGSAARHHLRVYSGCLIVNLVVVQVLDDKISKDFQRQEPHVFALSVNLVNQNGKQEVNNISVLVYKDLAA